MQKVKFMFLAALCVALWGLSSCSSDDDHKPEEVVKTALTAKYPNVANIEWEVKGAYIVADCRIDGKDTDVWFAADAAWKMTEYELLLADLPEAVLTGLAQSEYATWRVDDRDLLEYPGRSEYVIEVEEGAKEIDVYFSPTGELLRTKDVSSGDDTHWPE